VACYALLTNEQIDTSGQLTCDAMSIHIPLAEEHEWNHVPWLQYLNVLLSYRKELKKLSDPFECRQSCSNICSLSVVSHE